MAPRSNAWHHFVRTIANRVKCNICSAILATKGKSTSSMIRHLRLKHPMLNLKQSHSTSALEMDADNNTLQESTPSVFLMAGQNEEAQDSCSVSKTLRSAVWNYFTRTTPNNVECNICSAILTFKGSSTSSMMRHLKLKHLMFNLKESYSIVVQEMDEDDNSHPQDSTPSVSMVVSRYEDVQTSCSVPKAGRSTVWEYFIRTLPNKAQCNVCSATLTICGSSTSSMVRHLRLKHPMLNLKKSHSSPVLEMDEENHNPVQESTPSESMVFSQNEDVQPSCSVPISGRSTVWEYFIRILPNKVQCNVCSAILSVKGSSTSSMTRHLRHKHPMLNLKESCSRPVLEVDEEGDHLQESTPSVSMAVDQNEDVQSSHSDTKYTHQASISGCKEKPLSTTKYAKIDEQLLRFIIKSYQALSMVECPEFKELILLLNPNYDPPSKKTLSDILLPKLYDHVWREVRKEIESASFISLTTGGWTSLENENSFAVTAHLIDSACCLKSYLLSLFKFSGEPDSENIAIELKRITEEWSIQQKVVACTTDNGADMIGAVELCNWWHVPCFAHSLDLVVQNSLEVLTETRSKAKVVAEFFQCSPQALEYLHSIQKQMGCAVLTPEQECSTKSNSTYDMLKSLLDMKEPIQSVTATVNCEPLQNLTDEDWLIIEKSCEVLAGFDGVMKEISSEKTVTLSETVLLSTGLLSYCQELKASDSNNNVIGRLISKLSDEVYQRLVKKYEELDIVWEVLLLDPRFKSKGFGRDEERLINTKETIVDRCCEILDQIDPNPKVVQEESPSHNTGAVWKYFDAVASDLTQPIVDGPRTSSLVEMDKYLSLPLLPRLEDPLCWWKEHKEIFPTLYKIMESHLCISATSLHCKRILSEEGHLISQKCNQLSSKMMFLNFNMK